MSSLDDQVLEIVEPILEPMVHDDQIAPIIEIQGQNNQTPIELESRPIEGSNHVMESVNDTKNTNDQKQSSETAKSQQPLKTAENKGPRYKKPRKLILYKCKVCKTTGKRSQVIMCSKCKFHFHNQCLDPEKIVNQSTAFVCEICQRPLETTLPNSEVHRSSSERSSIQNKQALQKQTQNQAERERPTGFLNISKLLNLYRANFKKEEWKRKLYQFYKRYPYCFQKNKIVFPIEDHLLHIYQSLFPSYCKTSTPRPIPSFQNCKIPKQHYNDLLEIEVFFMNFWQDLKVHNFFKPRGQKQANQMELQRLNRKNLHKKFASDGMSDVYAWILETLLRMYLNEIMDRNRVDNMKYISANPFFNLLATINQNEGLSQEFVIKQAPEIIKNLIKIPSFRRSFMCEFDGSDLHQFLFPKVLTLQTKIEVITKLIRGLCDTDCFKEIVMKKSELISVLTKEKGQILQLQKVVQSQNLPLREKIKQFEKQLKQLAFSDPKEYAKRYEPSTKKLQKLIITHKTNNQKIDEFKQKVKQITRKVPFVNNVVKYLGLDRFKSEYFFYKNQKTKIFVKYRDSFLSEQEYVNDTFLIYEGKEQIQQLKGWLNAKGSNQRGLLFNINNLEQKDLLVLGDSISNGVNEDITLEETSIQDKNRQKSFGMIKRQETSQILMFCQHLFKETLYSNQQTLQQRQTQVSQLFYKINFPNELEYKKNYFPHNKTQLNHLSEDQTRKLPNQQQKLHQEHPLKTLFSKYPSKLWNWNEKVKKFWFEFLDFCTSDPLYETEGNLLILSTVWRITMRLYHSESMRKKEKIEKKKQKEKINKEKQESLLLLVHQDQFQDNTSPDQPNMTSQMQAPTARRLRKRQNPIDFKDRYEDSPNESVNTLSKKQSSNLQESSKISSKIESKAPSKISEKRSYKKKLLSNGESKSKAKKNRNKKLSIESQSEQVSQQELNSVEIDQSNLSDQEDRQQQNKQPKSSQQIVSQEYNNTTSDPDQESPQQIFCQQCFQNVNYDTKASKAKLIKCPDCFRVYHKKCLDEDDAARLKAQPNSWKCDDCEKKTETNHKKLAKNDIQTNSQNQNKKKKVSKNKEQQKIVTQTANIKQNGSKISEKVNKLALTLKLTEPSTKSKASQKAQKKQRKKKVQQELKVKQQSLQNSESLQEDYKQQPKRQSKSAKKNNFKMTKQKKIDKQQEPLQKGGKNKSTKKSVKQTKKSKQKLNTSISSAEQRRSTRDKSNRKKIIEQSQQERNIEQPNSEDQQYSQSASI